MACDSTPYAKLILNHDKFTAKTKKRAQRLKRLTENNLSILGEEILIKINCHLKQKRICYGQAIGKYQTLQKPFFNPSISIIHTGWDITLIFSRPYEGRSKRKEGVIIYGWKDVSGRKPII